MPCSSKNPLYDPYFKMMFEIVEGRELMFQHSKRMLIKKLPCDQDMDADGCFRYGF
jgi:hypothetical protein